MTAQNGNLDKIEHIVVLMMENRSFDNVLGWLYPDNQDFRGIQPGMSNPSPGGGSIPVTEGTDFTAPYPDPHEPYEYVYRQMFNQPPTMPVPNTTAVPEMQGFVIDYADAIEQADAANKNHGKPPVNTAPGIIMNYFTPESLPVINGLAKSYAVCDNWFSSVPTQTFPNRSFVHAATSGGNVYNTWKTGPHSWDLGVFINDTPTIYNLLEEAKVGWKIYHGGGVLFCNALVTQKQLWDFAFKGVFDTHDKRFFPLAQFLDDLKVPGALPAYTFLEPNFICSRKYGPENDMHPAYAAFDHGSPTDVRDGEQLIFNLYTALRASEYWEKTLFVITFDEHGGCFDHLPPTPPTVSPDGIVIPYTDGTNGGSNFDFTRFGVRVPSILISPWIAEGTICHTQFDHTSIIKTVANKWLNGHHLTRRDLAANDLSEVLSLPAPRTDSPSPVMNPVPPFTGCADQQPSPLHRDMLAAAASFVAHKPGVLIDVAALDTKEKMVTALDHISDKFMR